MSGWPVRRLVALYPRAWRERYGSEVGDLTDELISVGQTTRLRAGIDLAGGAALEHGRALTRSPAAGLGSGAEHEQVRALEVVARQRDERRE